MISSTFRRPLLPTRRLHLIAALLVGAYSAGACGSPATADPPRDLLIVVDGLRPDYVTAETMPNLIALGERGVIFTHHHSVFPTVTRVNASSISTGAYPGTHGLLGNTVFFPAVNPTQFLDTSDRQNLLAIAATEPLLTATSMAEALHSAGRRMLVVSSGSSGSAFLNNHLVSGGAILHYQYALPSELGEAMKTLGPVPSADGPPGALDTYAVDAFLKVGLPRVDPTVTVMWLSDLDTTAHAKGIGDPATIAVLRNVDREIKRIEDGLRSAGVFDQYNIWVTSDHGFSTHTGGVNLASILTAAKASANPRPIVSSGGAIYVPDDQDTTVNAIVAQLQTSPGVGAIFTRGREPGALDGRVPGTLSFDAIRWDHARSAQILYSPDWTDAANVHGIPGAVASGGTAGHGSSSPWDIHNTLIAAGPSLRRGATIASPSANVDFAPTFLALLGIDAPVTMQGRSLSEAFAGAADLPASTVTATQHHAATPDGGYDVTATFSTVNVGGRTFRYFDRTSVKRR
jgi:arylsulfatase A-like enzyme